MEIKFGKTTRKKVKIPGRVKTTVKENKPLERMDKNFPFRRLLFNRIKRKWTLTEIKGKEGFPIRNGL